MVSNSKYYYRGNQRLLFSFPSHTHSHVLNKKKIILTVEKATPFHSLNWLNYPYQAFQSLSSRHVRLCGINALTVGGTRNHSGNLVNNTKTNIPHCHGKIKKKKKTRSLSFVLLYNNLTQRTQLNNTTTWVHSEWKTVGKGCKKTVSLTVFLGFSAWKVTLWSIDSGGCGGDWWRRLFVRETIWCEDPFGSQCSSWGYMLWCS